LEENMLRNLEEMRSYRKGMDEVVERRKAAARSFMEQFKPNPDTIKLAELKPAPHLDPAHARPKENTSMKDRIAAMEVNAESNNEVLGDHRKVLDTILAIRQAAAERAMDPSKASASEALAAAANQIPAEEVPPEPVSINQKCREIQRNSKWMGSAMQKAAVSKARSDDVKEKRAWQEAELRQEAEDANQPQELPTSRPHSVTGASRPSISHLSCDPKRPKSSRRPISAASTAWASRPGSSWPVSALSRGGTSGRSSRPSSVSSLTARFRNLQECVERNHETLQSHRHDLDMVVKMRQERVQRLADDLLQSVKNMYEQREAKRNSA